MTGDEELPIRERLARCVEHLTHLLPAQAPISNFVHHNTLHGFQHLPFAEALAAAQQLTGAATYWPESRFRAEFAAGRIARDDLQAALDELLPEQGTALFAGRLQRHDVLLASLLVAAGDVGRAHVAWREREHPVGADDCLSTARRLLGPWSQRPGDDWQDEARQRWKALCAEVGERRTLRSLLEAISGEDVY